MYIESSICREYSCTLYQVVAATRDIQSPKQLIGKGKSWASVIFWYQKCTKFHIVAGAKFVDCLSICWGQYYTVSQTVVGTLDLKLLT